MDQIQTSDIPDATPNSAERYIYIEHASTDSFSTVFETIGDDYSGTLPSSGGIMNEEVIIDTPDGGHYCCISTRGDHDGWRRLIEDYAASNGFGLARVEGEHVRVTKDRKVDTFELSACQAYSTD